MKEHGEATRIEGFQIAKPNNGVHHETRERLDSWSQFKNKAEMPSGSCDRIYHFSPSHIIVKIPREQPSLCALPKSLSGNL